MNPPNDKLKTLGQNVRRCRHALKISQEELAYRSGFHRTYMSDVERGARNVTFLSLLAIANGLGVSIPDLTTGVQSTRDEKPLGTLARER
jgi:transcriptional regulator with XRE-family HTH domain